MTTLFGRELGDIGIRQLVKKKPVSIAAIEAPV
jgi:hypothetical protein